MNEDRINQIKNNVRDLMRQILEIGEEPPEFIQDLLLKVIEKSQQQIQQLRQEEQQQQVSKVAQHQIESQPSNDAQLLWILAGQQPQAFISYLRNYPTPSTQALLSNPTALSQTIDQLSQMMPEGQPPFINGISHADLQSSNVWGAGYDKRKGKLRVRFQGGSEYEYDGVPENIFRAFIKGNASARTKGKNRYGEWWVGKNPSLGAALNQYIKAGGFPYRKLR